MIQSITFDPSKKNFISICTYLSIFTYLYIRTRTYMHIHPIAYSLFIQQLLQKMFN